MKRFVVVGLGNFGATVTEALQNLGHDVIAIDVSESAVDRIALHAARAAVGDGKDIRVLERIGARGADIGVVSTGNDITASILATMALRDLGVAEIYCKVISHDHARVMEQLGVTETVFPERDSGLRLAARITSVGILNYFRMGANFSIQEMVVPKRWVGQTLRTLELPRNYRVSVIALHDVETDRMIPIPDPDAALRASDTLVIAGTDTDLAAIAEGK